MDRSLRRKGMTTESALITIIIFGAAMVVLVLIYNLLFGVGKMQFTEKDCQSSLMLTTAADYVNSYGNTACWAKLPNPVPLHCNRNFVDVKDSKVVRNAKETKMYSPRCPDGAANCLPKNVVAEEMRSCWHQFFDGEQRVFQQTEIGAWEILRMKDYGRACFVCSEVTLHDADMADFDDYLANTKFQGPETYYDYFSNGKAWCDKDLIKPDTPTCYEAIASGKPATFGAKLLDEDRPDLRPDAIFSKDTSGTYAVVFMRRGRGSCDTSKEDGKVFNQHLTNTVQVVPADEIAQACDVVIV